MAAEHSFVSDPPSDLVCQVCMKVLQEPHATECCGQHFCKVCLEKWLEKSEEKACPHCREPNFNHMLYKPLQRKINELEVYCTHRDEGCGEIMVLAKLNSHLSNDCVFVKIDCPNDCGLAIMRKDMDNHVLNDCLKRKELCSYCKFETTFNLMDDHLKVCDKMPVPCPRNCDSQKLVRGELQKHEDVCPNLMVKCPFSEAGCTNEMPRKDLDSHIETGSTTHLLKFMASYSSLKASHRALTANYKVLKAECGKLKAEAKQINDLKSQAVIAIERIKDMPDQLTNPLESLVSALNNYQLDVADDSIMYAIPSATDVAWTSPPFFVSPGYKFCIHLENDSIHQDSLELLLLKGHQDGLKLPPEIEYRVELRHHFNSQNRRYGGIQEDEALFHIDPEDFAQAQYNQADASTLSAWTFDITGLSLKYVSVRLSEPLQSPQPPPRRPRPRYYRRRGRGPRY